MVKEVMVKWVKALRSGKFKIKEVDYCGEYDHEECLADLNDTGRKFKTIAKIIEKNYEQL